MGIEQQWENAANVLVALVTTYGLRVLGAIIILCAGWMTSRLLYTAVVRLCQKSPRIDRTVALFIGNGVRYTVLVFTFVAVLTTFGIATTSFVAVLGALGIAIGLALQGTLSNLAAGIMLVVFRPFHIGDRVETGGVTGVAREINLFFTEIDGDDNTRIIIPNGKLWGEIVKVPTRNDTARIDLRIPRPANEDVGTSISRLKHLIERDQRTLNVSTIGIDTLEADKYILAAQVWTQRESLTALKYDLNRSIKEEFDRKPPAAVERRAG
ncbi:MAG: mechanosensitive ion channel [Reyranella sp.]|uniref:mechanosensitive ion channel family protein n=1 Tax=Reyranella sp. TaxID=1929291 RepID=UPI001224AAA8|nr:mechanosensitive ion channel domain-containing protein [Reyranella sp.]TAJ84437.1 MAG: mechanosensitive ion channel [Reyranella sp.]TBR28795.1 MAG: mechanosensitive ion channel [Reyranella sp.]